MDSEKYMSVSIKTEIVEQLRLLSEEDMRSIPMAIEYLAKTELKFRLDKIKEKKNNLS